MFTCSIFIILTLTTTSNDSDDDDDDEDDDYGGNTAVKMTKWRCWWWCRRRRWRSQNDNGDDDDVVGDNCDDKMMTMVMIIEEIAETITAITFELSLSRFYQPNNAYICPKLRFLSFRNKSRGQTGSTVSGVRRQGVGETLWRPELWRLSGFLQTQHPSESRVRLQGERKLHRWRRPPEPVSGMPLPEMP